MFRASKMHCLKFAQRIGGGIGSPQRGRKNPDGFCRRPTPQPRKNETDMVNGEEGALLIGNSSKISKLPTLLYLRNSFAQTC